MSSSPGGFLSYSPILDRESRLTGLHIAAHARNGMVGLASLQGLTRAWPSESLSIMVDVEDAAPGPAYAALQLPGNGMLHLGQGAADHGEWLKTANGHCPQLCLPPGCDLLAGAGKPRIVMPLSALTGKVPAATALITGVDSPAALQAALAAGAQQVVGWSFMTPPAPSSGKRQAVPASAANVVKLLDLINRDADVGEIGAILKRDVVLAYKLVALVNSAAHGLPVEVHSYQHAVTMLGMQRLKRWLSILLATCGGGNRPVVLLRTALIRAAFFEEIGRQLGYTDDADDLFLCGAFSLLDVILGMPFDDILEQVALPERIVDALINQGEPFGPILRLAEAVEQGNAEALDAAAGQLMLPPARVNAALLFALRAGLRVDLG
jgi:HDOD domain